MHAGHVLSLQLVPSWRPVGFGWLIRCSSQRQKRNAVLRGIVRLAVGRRQSLLRSKVYLCRSKRCFSLVNP